MDDSADGRYDIHLWFIEKLEKLNAMIATEIAEARTEGRVDFDRGTRLITLAREMEAAFDGGSVAVIF